jgi:hypothetical protein
VSGAMSLPNCTRVLRNRFILARVRPLPPPLPWTCESSSDSERDADGGNGGLMLPEICNKVHILPFRTVTQVARKIILRMRNVVLWDVTPCDLSQPTFLRNVCSCESHTA